MLCSHKKLLESLINKNYEDIESIVSPEIYQSIEKVREVKKKLPFFCAFLLPKKHIVCFKKKHKQKYKKNTKQYANLRIQNTKCLLF